MASILDKYGIKEVADMTFYKLENGNPTVPVLYLDTCKTTTIEQTGEEADARGGKGNAILMSWDYNKEITVTIEDALFSAKSMAIMFGGSENVDPVSHGLLMRTEEWQAKESIYLNTGSSNIAPADVSGKGWDPLYTAPTGVRYGKVNPKFFTADGKQVVSASVSTGDKGYLAIENNQKLFCTYDLIVDGGVIEISSNSFPGTYYITGDTYARPKGSTEDEFFQFIIPEGKIQAENTITLEADGDPTTFSLNVKVLKPADGGPMMKLVKYNPIDSYGAKGVVQASLVHDHTMDESNDIAYNGYVIDGAPQVTKWRVNDSGDSVYIGS